MSHRLSAVLIVAAAFVLAVLSPSPAAAQELNLVDHYKCYDVLDFDPQFPPIPVWLRDQFGQSLNEVLRPLFLCNPVSKNGEPIRYPNIHLVCYQIVDDQPIRSVLISNQFHELTMRIKDGRLLCVPSKKVELQ